ncbi:MAG: dihydrofolate reductase family protein [Candidatus Moranbacteria bacterium]|nr:dihydrofolate reductase family protein [Candidatus Moranbacteria bacterium]
MKIILFMATSLNGMIASKSGKEDFLSHTNWMSFGEFAKKHGCFIIGRKTFESVQKWPDYNFNDIDAKLKIVISSNKDLELEPPYLLANSPKDAMGKAAAMNFESAILTGGSTINSAFLNENLIDEVMINIEPAIIGSGIPLFAECDFEKRLSFIDSVRIASDILQVRYKVNKN